MKTRVTKDKIEPEAVLPTFLMLAQITTLPQIFQQLKTGQNG